MSYVIHIWHHPVPRTFNDAQEFVFDTERVSTEQNPLFISLAEQLTARYPCGSTLEYPDDSVWNDQPFDGQCAEDIYAVGISSKLISEVQPFVVATANNLGLTVYDMQVGKAYIPGAVLEPSIMPIKPSNPWWREW